MRLTGAHIRIETGSPNGKSEEDGDHDDDDSVDQQAGAEHKRRHERGAPVEDSERRVTITGTDQQQYKVPLSIFQSQINYWFITHHKLYEIIGCRALSRM